MATAAAPSARPHIPSAPRSPAAAPKPPAPPHPTSARRLPSKSADRCRSPAPSFAPPSPPRAARSSSSATENTFRAHAPIAAACAAKSISGSTSCLVSFSRLLKFAPPVAICSRLMQPKPRLSSTTMVSFVPSLHRAGDLGIHHHVAAIAQHHDHVVMRLGELHAQPAGDLVAHGRVAVFHVVRRPARRPASSLCSSPGSPPEAHTSVAAEPRARGTAPITCASEGSCVGRVGHGLRRLQPGGLGAHAQSPPTGGRCAAGRAPHPAPRARPWRRPPASAPGACRHRRAAC